MNILDLVSQHLKELGFVCGPYNPGCFFFTSEHNKICLILNDGRMIDIMRTKEPTVILIYRGWVDDMRTCLIDLCEPDSLDQVDRIIYELQD